MEIDIKFQMYPYGKAWDASFTDSRSTPTVEDEYLYISSGMGDLACLNAIDGSIIWQVEASKNFMVVNEVL